MNSAQLYRSAICLGECGFIEDLLAPRYTIYETDQESSIGPEAYIETIMGKQATIDFISAIKSYRAKRRKFGLSYKVISINVGDWFYVSVSGNLRDVKALEPAAQSAGATLVSQ